jgi:conjugal transfer pilus assembly protein TraE
MDFKRFFSSYSGVIQENRIWRALALVLVTANLVLGTVAFSRRETVVLVPANLSKEVRVGVAVGDRDYRETWGLFFAQLLGNVTPKTIDFVLERVGKCLSPGIYQETLKAMYAQAKELKVNNLAISFEPAEVAYDEKTDRVLVKGIALLKGAFGAPQTLARTYELGIEVRDYRPVLTYLASYEKKEEGNAGKVNKDRPDSAGAGGSSGGQAQP